LKQPSLGGLVISPRELNAGGRLPFQSPITFDFGFQDRLLLLQFGDGKQSQHLSFDDRVSDVHSDI